MAPDFAYEIAKSSAQDTQVNIGFVETKGNNIKMELLLDLGEGQKKYYLEKDTQMHMHKDATGADENGYSNINEAIAASEFLEGDEKEKNQKEKPLSKAIDELEDSLKNSNKVQFGHIAYWKDKDQQDAEKEWNNADSKKGGEAGYIIDIDSSEQLVNIIQLLVNYDLAEIVDDGNNSNKILKIKNPDDENVKRIKELFINHFENGDIIEIAKNIHEFLENSDEQPDYKNYENWEDTYTGKEIKKNGVNFDLKQEYKVYMTTDNCDNTFYIPGVCYGTASGLSGILGADVFWQMSIENIWDWFFGGTELGKDGNWYDFFGGIDKHFPIRTYYRLKDEDGNVVKFNLNDSKDFVYADGGNTYYIDNENGWFWRRAIPIEIYNAIMSKEQKSEITIGENADENSAKEVSQILDEAVKTNTEEFTRFVPIILNVTGHWYENVDYKDCYQWVDDDSDEENKLKNYEYTAKDGDSTGIVNASNAGIIYMKETYLGKIKQIGEPRIEKNTKLKELVEKDYYIYDGVRKSDKPKKINFKETAIDAIAMLEQIEGEQAQHIIRMFKEFMISQGIIFEETQATDVKKELFAKVIKDYDTTDKLLTDNESDTVIRANIPPTQEGFDKDLIVQAPIAGKVTYRTDDSVCILINAPGKDYDQYTILISGFDVGHIKKGDEDVEIDVYKDMEVKEGTALGKTIKQDLKLVLRDENGAIIKNEYLAVDIEKIKGQKIKSNVSGEVTAILDDSLVIKITEGTDKGCTMTVSGIEISNTLKEGSKIKKDDVIGKATGDEITLTIVDENNILVKKEKGTVVKNEYIDIDVDISSAAINASGVSKVYGGEFSASKNGTRTKENILKAISSYPNEQARENFRSVINELLEIQSLYDIDPLFALSVFVNESGGGTNWDSVDPSTYNWASITWWTGHPSGKYIKNGRYNWCKYDSFADATLGFGNYIRNSNNMKGKTTIEDVGRIYCVPPDNWIKEVSSQYESFKAAIK